MSLALIGRSASYEFRWRRWALLRDVVVAHLEGGAQRYPHFSSLGDALAGTPVRLPAKELADEVEAMRPGLAKQPIGGLVLGDATAAVLYMGARLEAPRPLTPRELSQVAPFGDAENLAEYFASMLDSIAHVCAHPAEDGTVEVVDG